MKSRTSFSYIDNREMHIKFKESEVEDINWGSVALWLIVAGFLTYNVHSCVAEMDTPEYKAKQEAEQKECNTPHLVSEVDGVKLYAIKPNCDRWVYFSERGTHTTHTEHHGKTSTTVDDDTSNDQ